VGWGVVYGGMEVCGRHFPKPLVDRIQETVRIEPSISRRELSRRVCQWLDWRSPNGRFQDMSCRKALTELSRRGLLDLPAPRGAFGFAKGPSKTIEPEVATIRCSLAQLGQISVEPVSSRYCRDSKVWFALMEKYHYLGRGSLCGAQIRYVIKSPEYGYLGALAFSSACFALGERDKYIGWTEAARRANLQKVVNNDRFLILPTVKVQNLASHVLSLTLSRLVQDWEQRYRVRPVMVETFVDPSLFDGACYKAANWDCVGESAGRRDGIPKKIFLYPLCRKWRKILCIEPQIRLGDVPRAESPQNWAEEEFSTMRVYDDRLKQRLYRIVQDFYNRPEANIPEACGGKAQTIGAYRFFQNKKMSMEVVLTAHTEATIERIKDQRVVLAPQDTTTLNYTHPMTEGLGPTNTKADKSVGLILHDTVAFTPEGTPLGILDAQCWARDPQEQGKKHQRQRLPIEQKESMKWLRSFRRVAEIQKLCPDTMLVSVGDRESDVYELFMETSKDRKGPKLLVRAEKTRERKVEDQYLWDSMAQKEVAGVLRVHIPRRGPRKARDAWVDIRFAKVQLAPPQRFASEPPIQIWVVYALEDVQESDESIDPAEWMLLTTVEVNGFEDAKRTVEWYAGRWGIEVYHRTLKSGCRIKDRQFETADRLETCLGVDMVVAWRIYHMTMLGRETPEVPCTAFFKDVEWKALCCYVNKTPIAPEKPPTMSEAVRMVGAMGGHLGRQGDGPPGTQVLWRGLQRLDTAVEMYVIFTGQNVSHPMRSGP
jgi:hypothetical protein